MTAPLSGRRCAQWAPASPTLSVTSERQSARRARAKVSRNHSVRQTAQLPRSPVVARALHSRGATMYSPIGLQHSGPHAWRTLRECAQTAAGISGPTRLIVGADDEPRCFASTRQSLRARRGSLAGQRRIPVTSTERTQCLDAATLSALVRGKLPVDRKDAVQAHLPGCSKCLGIVAAGVGERVRSKRPAFRRDSVVREPPIRHGPAQLILVVLSLVALGGSLAWWHASSPAGAGVGDSSPERLVRPAALPAAMDPSLASPPPPQPGGLDRSAGAGAPRPVVPPR